MCQYLIVDDNIMCSVEEAARYLESYKSLEHKGPELLQGNDTAAATDLITAVSFPVSHFFYFYAFSSVSSSRR